MKTLKLTAEHFKKEAGSYFSLYIGKDNVSDFDGHIEIADGLGWVRFEGDVKAKGSIVVGVGSGIEAGGGIEAGEGIKACWGIVTFSGPITAKMKISIHPRCAIVAGAFSYDGEQTVQASEIEGKVAYGKPTIITAEPVEKPTDEEVNKAREILRRAGIKN